MRSGKSGKVILDWTLSDIGADNQLMYASVRNLLDRKARRNSKGGTVQTRALIDSPQERATVQVGTGKLSLKSLR